MKKDSPTLPFPGIIALDLDGTLLDENHEISDRTVAVLQRMQERGALPVISTGRSYEAVLPFQERLGLNNPVICYNGAMICDGASGAVLHEAYLPDDIARYALSLTRSRGIHYQGFHKGALLFEKRGPESEFYEALTGLTGQVVNFDDREALNFTKALLIGPPGRPSGEWPELGEIQKNLEERFGPRLYTAFSRPFFLELINGEASKARALERLGGERGIGPERIAAFGDGFNDVEMLSYAGISVAMANAPEEVKGRARFVTESNNDDGVAAFLESRYPAV